jgi:hypothetical protein
VRPPFAAASSSLAMERARPPTTSTQGKVFFRLGDVNLEPAEVGIQAEGISSMDAEQTGMRIVGWAHGGTYPLKGWSRAKLLKLPMTEKISDKVSIKDQYIALDPSSMCWTLYEQQLGDDNTPQEAIDEWRLLRSRVETIPELQEFAVHFDRRASRLAYATALDTRMVNLEEMIGMDALHPGPVWPSISIFAPVARILRGTCTHPQLLHVSHV